MSNGELDFLKVGTETFANVNRFNRHIQENIDVSELSGKLSIIGTIVNFDNQEEFRQSLSGVFRIERSLDDLLLMRSRAGDIPYYVHWNQGCPLFFTTGTKTQDIPNTLGEYVRRHPDISRMWVGKKQMEEIRRSIVTNHKDILVPYFTAHYSPNSDIDGVTRPGFERTVQYYGDDGLEAFKEVKNKYGVFPTNVQFKKPGVFKFRITQEGVFTINDGSANPALSLIQHALEELRQVKDVINSAGLRTVDSDFGAVPNSEPWLIELNRELEKTDVEHLEESLDTESWDFGVFELNKSTRSPVGFSGEIVDRINYGTVGLRTRDEETIRVFPREETGFGQSVRLFSFSNNNIDMKSQASKA